MKLSVGKIGWFVCLVGLGVLTISAINYKKHGELTSIEVKVIDLGDGDHFLTEADVHGQVLDLLGGELTGDITSASAETIERQLKANPFVEDVNVYVNSDGELGVTVEQRRPVARVFAKGQRFYLDAIGNVIPESQSFTARLPVVTGDVPVSLKDKVAEEELISFLQTLADDPFFAALVEQIDFEGDQLTLVPKTGSAVINFGRIENVDKKLASLKTFYRDVYSKMGFEGYSRIDVSVKGRIICKDNKKTN